MEDDMMTIPQAAALLDLDRSVVLRAVKSGRIPGQRMGAKIWLVKREDVLAYPYRRAAGEKRGRKRATPAEEQP